MLLSACQTFGRAGETGTCACVDGGFDWTDEPSRSPKYPEDPNYCKNKCEPICNQPGCFQGECVLKDVKSNHRIVEFKGSAVTGRTYTGEEPSLEEAKSNLEWWCSSASCPNGGTPIGVQDVTITKDATQDWWTPTGTCICAKVQYKCKCKCDKIKKPPVTPPTPKPKLPPPAPTPVPTPIPQPTPTRVATTTQQTPTAVVTPQQPALPGAGTAPTAIAAPQPPTAVVTPQPRYPPGYEPYPPGYPPGYPQYPQYPVYPGQ